MPGRIEHSNEKWEMVIDAIFFKGKSQAQAARDLNIPKSTVNNIVKAYNQNERTSKLKKGGSRNTTLTDNLKERLLKLIDDDCTITLQSMIEKLNLSVHRSTVWRWLKALNISFKMTRSIPEKRNCSEVKLERICYADWYQAIHMDLRYKNLVFIDESPFSLHMLRSHGRSLVGTTPNPVVENSRGRNVTMILAISAISVVSCEAVLGGVNHVIFQDFLTKLKDILGDGEYIILMDNVKFHHSNKEFYDDYPYEIHYLPRYSPFLNPCEEVFSQIKSNVCLLYTSPSPRDTR